MAKVMDCDILLNDFELQSRNFVHFFIFILVKVMKKQVLPVEDIGISPWPVDGLNSVQMRRPREAGGCQTII